MKRVISALLLTGLLFTGGAAAANAAPAAKSGNDIVVSADRVGYWPF